MPELPEIKLMCLFLNKFSNNEIKEIITKNVKRKPELVLPFKMKWSQHGKEMCLETNNNQKLFFTLGFGTWSIVNPNRADDKIKNNTVLSFVIDDNVHVSLIDQRRFSKWKIQNDFSKSRGPDPLKDIQAFKDNIKKNLNKKVFDKPIYEMLLDQKYFCGVGNYLRAVILHYINDDPFQSAREYINKHGDTFLDVIPGIMNESYELQRDGKMEDAWYYPYGSGEKITDSNKRTFWYDKKWKKN